MVARFPSEKRKKINELLGYWTAEPGYPLATNRTGSESADWRRLS